MAGCFWLKSALDLVLAVLKEDDPIMLAPNSAQAPPLMPGASLLALLGRCVVLCLFVFVSSCFCPGGATHAAVASLFSVVA